MVGDASVERSMPFSDNQPLFVSGLRVRPSVNSSVTRDAPSDRRPSAARFLAVYTLRDGSLPSSSTGARIIAAQTRTLRSPQCLRVLCWRSSKTACSLPPARGQRGDVAFVRVRRGS